MSKTIITVVGKDAVGITAKVCTFLAEHNVNILDISQTIVQGFFNMMMIVDTSEMELSFEEFSLKLETCGKEINVKIKSQREGIFTSMHRI